MFDPSRCWTGKSWFRHTFALFSLAAVAGLASTPAEARRVALVIGQDAYPDSGSATVGLPRLDNSGNDARRVAELFGKHGFEVLSCDGKTPGCFDLDRAGLLAALAKLTSEAKGADMALVFYAGHGLASEEGNILAPIDAKVNCATGAITQGVLVEDIMRATEPVSAREPPHSRRPPHPPAGHRSFACDRGEAADGSQ